MFKASRCALILGLAGAMAGLPAMLADDRDRDQDNSGVAEAIRYEKAKQAAADRQERIEEARERGQINADRMAPEAKHRDKEKGARARKTPPPSDSGNPR